MEPDCKIECNRPELLPENNVIEYIMVRYGSMLITGEGSISAEGIRLVLDIEEIEDRALITYKIVVYLRTALETKNKELIDGNKDNSFKS